MVWDTRNSMNQLEQAILKTILYGDVFQFPMTSIEIHRFLIHARPISYEDIERTLRQSTVLKRYLIERDRYYALKERVDDIATRQTREQVTQQVWDTAWGYGRILAYLPFVRMVAITGALAMRNPFDEHDDFDYIIITKAGRVWLARAFSILLVRFAKLRGVIICPNYVLAEDKLPQTRRDLYIAHELAQMVPIHGAELHHQLLNSNPWAISYLANTDTGVRETKRLGLLGRGAKGLAEFVLSGFIGNKLEAWEYRRKRQRFQTQMEPEQAGAAEIDAQQVKGHFNDHGSSVVQQYQRRLVTYGLMTAAMPMVGD